MHLGVADYRPHHEIDIPNSRLTKVDHHRAEAEAAGPDRCVPKPDGEPQASHDFCRQSKAPPDSQTEKEAQARHSEIPHEVPFPFGPSEEEELPYRHQAEPHQPLENSEIQ